MLILGSLPGERSLGVNQYYAHPQNQFWRLIAAIADVEVSSRPYGERLAVLGDVGIGLWDVVASASRSGSLDSRIVNHAVNDLQGMARSLPALRCIAFNGGKAATIGGKPFGRSAEPAIVTLPSSSPAYTLPFAAKREAWLELRRWLN